MVSFCFPWGLFFSNCYLSGEQSEKSHHQYFLANTSALFEKPQHISVQSKNSVLSSWNKILRVKPHSFLKLLVKHLLFKSGMRSSSSYCIQKTGNLPFSYIKRKQVHPGVNLCGQKQAGMLQCRLPQHLFYKPNYPSLHRCKRHLKSWHLRQTDNFKSL